MSKLVTLEFYRGSLIFSAGHFTIFSATERERIHGHNYYLEAAIDAKINEPGITFDYEIFREHLTNLCQKLHLFFLLPEKSPHLQILHEKEQYHVIFNHQSLYFPKSDTLLLPLANITLEELSNWFIKELTENKIFLQQHHIHAIRIKCFNGTEHSAEAHWP